MIKYYLNEMGPYHLNWYRERGLTKRVSKIINRDFPTLGLKSGDIYEYDEVTEYYSAGRIDVCNDEDVYGRALSVGTMTQKDWNMFSQWLRGFSTDTVLELTQLVEEYEKTNNKIRWWIDD